jgi:hypothetical protein
MESGLPFEGLGAFHLLWTSSGIGDGIERQALPGTPVSTGNLEASLASGRHVSWDDAPPFARAG